eukprot:3533362-Prymnesium_polylepis.1
MRSRTTTSSISRCHRAERRAASSPSAVESSLAADSRQHDHQFRESAHVGAGETVASQRSGVRAGELIQRDSALRNGPPSRTWRTHVCVARTRSAGWLSRRGRRTAILRVAACGGSVDTRVVSESGVDRPPPVSSCRPIFVR